MNGRPGDLAQTLRGTVLFKGDGDHRELHSVPARRSSDHTAAPAARAPKPAAAYSGPASTPGRCGATVRRRGVEGEHRAPQDRKSTRLNSSHANISYAVFCL